MRGRHGRDGGRSASALRRVIGGWRRLGRRDHGGDVRRARFVVVIAGGGPFAVGMPLAQGPAMRPTSNSLAQILALGAALGLLAGCPAKEEETGGSETDAVATTGTGTQGATTEEPTTSGPATGTDPTTGATTGGTTVDPSDGTTVDATTGAIDPVCECIDPAGFGSTSFTCGNGACGLISGKCVQTSDTTGGETGDTGTGGDTSDDPFDDCELEYDEAQIDCAIDLLIAGEGIVKWYDSSDQGFSEFGAFVQMLPGRQGLTRSYNRVDIGKAESNAGVVAIKSAEYFQGCKDKPTPGAKFGCLADWSDEEPAAQCDPADSADDF
jgi:hypothetical protein